MKKLYKILEYTPKIGNSENPYPVSLNFGNEIHSISEHDFLDFYKEYMRLKYQTSYEYSDKIHTINGKKDYRHIAIDCIQNLAHNLWRGWNEAASFDESYLDELKLWVNALDELRSTFGICRFPNNQHTSERITDLRSNLPKWIQGEFDFWCQAHEKDRAEKNSKFEH